MNSPVGPVMIEFMCGRHFSLLNIVITLYKAKKIPYRCCTLQQIRPSLTNVDIFLTIP